MYVTKLTNGYDVRLASYVENFLCWKTELLMC